jgi:hypothetical protein
MVAAANDMLVGLSERIGVAGGDVGVRMAESETPKLGGRFGNCGPKDRFKEAN